MTSTRSAPWIRWRTAFACLAGVSVAMLALEGNRYGRNLVAKSDRAFGDWILRHSGGPPENRDLVLLGIDEESLSPDSLAPEEIAASPALEMMSRRFPWDRRVWALAIDKLADAGAKLIVLDLLFSEPSDPEADAALSDALQRHADKVILGSMLSPAGADDKGQGWVLIEPDERFIFGQREIRLGYVNFHKDTVDGLVREARYTTTLGLENSGIRRNGEPEFRSLAAEVIHAMGKPVPSGNRELRLSGRLETGAADTYAPRSVYEIFSERSWKANYGNGEFFRDKVVMIGPVAPRFHDIIDTPMGPITGPQMHIQAIASGLEGAFVGRSTNPWPVMLGLALLTLVWTQWVRRPLVSIFGMTAIAFGVAFAAVAVGSLFSHIILVTGGFFTMGAGLAVAQSYDLVSERLEKARLRRDFRRFVSRDVADAMIARQDQWRETAAGVKREVVVLFSDVRGFTGMSELTDPEELVKQLNEYLTSMVEVIFRHGGTLDKFIGDAVMAHWGALGGGSAQDHARKAVLAAREMIVVLSGLNETWVAAGRKPFRIGVGLHAGEALAGEIGSPERTEFGVIGDTVNLASRLEGLTKAFHCDVVFSEAVRCAAGNLDGVIDLGPVRVKGRHSAVRLFGFGDEETVLGRLESFGRDEEGVLVMTDK